MIAAERTRQGLRIGDLAVDASVVEAIEAGRPGITTTQLEAIANALQVDAIALRDGAIKPRPTPSVYLRHRSIHQDLASADAAVLDVALEQARSRNALALLVGDDPGIFPGRRLDPRGVAADAPSAAAHQGYQLARELRRAVANEADAFSDLRDLAESKCGVTVLVRRLATIGSSELAVKVEDAAAIVLAPVTYVREPFARVWIAHGLCHVLFDADTGEVHVVSAGPTRRAPWRPLFDADTGQVQVVIDFNGERHDQQAEQRARAFAAELLLPRAGLLKLVGPPAAVSGEAAARNLVAMARDVFGSTWQVAANHLCNLGFIAPGLRDWLARQPPPAVSRP